MTLFTNSVDCAIVTHKIKKTDLLKTDLSKHLIHNSVKAHDHVVYLQVA